ncbi:MAG: acyl-CoA dehydrogenase family protein [Rhodobacter sp.]|nr:acyl-CoA dehydrogenase family protein [Rhodobacter sp.]
MDLTYGKEHSQFRSEVQQFVAEHWSMNYRSDERKISKFRDLATERGYIYRWLPQVYGGSEQPTDPIRARIVSEVFDAAKAPGEIRNSGVNILVPTLLTHGSAEQKTRFIEPTIRGHYIWCQGYSEPGSGSDLASLRTSAVLDGDEWVINGQKIWTSHARKAQYMFILVRTEPDASKHAGISYLLLDMTSPGITIRPLKQITGEATFNEVFFNQVRTPADWIVGERGQGWKISRTTMKHERRTIGYAPATERLFDNLVKLARRSSTAYGPALQDINVLQEITRIEGYVLAQRAASYHQLSMAAVDQETPMFALIAKLLATEIGHDIARLALKLLSDEALVMPQDDTGSRPDSKWVNQFLGSLGVSIAGGTSNIQRNIIAERGLGLPRHGYEQSRTGDRK